MLVAEEAVEIRVLRKQGKSIREIARMLAVSRNTVRRYLRGEGSTHYEREARPGKLDHYKQYIAERVRAAAPEWIPAPVLLRELRALGYPGGVSILKDHLATLIELCNELRLGGIAAQYPALAQTAAEKGSVATLKTVTEEVPRGTGRRGLRQRDRTACR